MKKTKQGIFCPGCGEQNVSNFYSVKNAPVHSVLLMSSREQAVNFPTGDIELGFCQSCGFIFNTAFDAALQSYSQDYEETQGFSETFNAFHKQLAQQMIDHHNLRNKSIIEIGCGKGEFLNLLCELGGNQGVGFDPAYVPGRSKIENTNVQFVQDFYSEKYAGYKADFICCKMTLEHIPNTLEFMQLVRRSIGRNTETTVMFQVPDVRRVLKDFAFWDIYYEHCSYFSAGSLASLFRKAGFDVTWVGNVYDDQYLVIEAKPSRAEKISDPMPEEESLETLAMEVEKFNAKSAAFIKNWRQKITAFHDSGKRVAIWGGGSKGVAFLTTLSIGRQVGSIIDINPHKNDTYLAGSGHKISLPQSLIDYRPDVVIIMNPIYEKEIQQELQTLGLSPSLLPLS